MTETFRGFSAQRSLPRGGERTGCTPSHCHSTSSVPRRCAQARVAVPTTLPLDVERTETVRSGPSGSAVHAGLHAQARVAVPPTLPLDVERTGCTPLHCHSTSNVPRRCAQARVAGSPGRRAERPSGTAAGPGTCSGPSPAASPERCRRRRGLQVAPASHGPSRGATDRAGCRERRESDERREAPERAKRVWLKREEGPAGRQREVREGPAPDRSHPGCGPGLPDGRGDANAAQKSMSTLLKNKFHSLSSGHIA